MGLDLRDVGRNYYMYPLGALADVIRRGLGPAKLLTPQSQFK